MSKIIEELSPEDFGKSFDGEVFDIWKKHMKEHEQAGVISMLLFCIGIASMWLLGGIVGLALFFILGIVGISVTAPKLSKSKRFQRQLDITDSDFKKAVAAARKRIKNEKK